MQLQKRFWQIWVSGHFIKFCRYNPFLILTLLSATYYETCFWIKNKMGISPEQQSNHVIVISNSSKHSKIIINSDCLSTPKSEQLLIASIHWINELVQFQCEVKTNFNLCSVNAFSALLTDLIRTPDFSWKEAKKILKKDSRYSLLLPFQDMHDSVVDPDWYIRDPTCQDSPDPEPILYLAAVLRIRILSTRFESGSFYHQAKIVRKTLNASVLWLLCDILSLKKM